MLDLGIGDKWESEHGSENPGREVGVSTTDESPKAYIVDTMAIFENQVRALIAGKPSDWPNLTQTTDSFGHSERLSGWFARSWGPTDPQLTAGCRAERLPGPRAVRRVGELRMYWD